MTLRQRTLLSIALTLAGLVAGVTLITSRNLISKYEDLERRETLRNLARVSDELKYQLGEMHAKTSDWSNWDDTYKFMADGNRAFVASNLHDILLNLDIMLFVRSDGSILNETRVSRAGHLSPPFGKDIVSALGLDGSGKARPSPDTCFAGIVMLANRDALLLSMRPVVRTDGTGPSRGWAIFALRLDQFEVARLASRSHLNITLYDIKDSSMPPGCQAATAHLTTYDPYATRALNEETVAGYELLSDYRGRPAKILRTTDRRDIYAEGRATQRTVIQTAVLTGSIFGILILWILEVAALSRVVRLRKQVERITDDLDERCMVELPGRDELSWLARVINSMVTGLREGKQQLAEKNHRLQTTVNELAATNHILANAVEGIAQIDENGHLTNANSSFANMHEYDMGRLSGCHWQALIAQEDHAQVQDAIDQAHPQRKSACEAQGRRSDGSLFHQEIVIVASGGPNPLTYHWFVRDISERKKLESEIQYQAFHDPLTGLPNRALFVDRLDMACKRASRKGEGIAVLFLDLDDFKIINDTMGHEAGDHLLAAIASRIQRSIRPQDTAARLGGDEFTVLLDGLECVEEAVHVAERILSGLEAPISLPTGKTFAGTSIGIAFCKGGNYDSDTLLHNADVAMYQAKCVPASTYAVFEPAMNDPAVERRELANALRVALSRDELSLHYQPIVNLHSGETLMVEALLRWRDPVRGDVPPSMFVAVAEEAGLMDMLGSWSLNHACKQMREWLDSIPETRKLIMSVNVSGKQLQRPDLNDTVRAALSEYGLPPEKLCLEVAAKLLPTDGERTLSLIKKLKETGVKLAIDDFGTGSHLISKLSEYPFDMVKIDGSITWMLESHEEARALVQAMMLMAKPAGVEVTAEGIETPGQLEYLREAGCTIGQGYIFGKALPAVEVVDYVRRKLLPGDDISSEFAA